MASDLEPYGCIDHGVDGLRVGPEEWLEALKNLATDTRLWTALRRKAKARVLRDYTWQQSQAKEVWLDAFRAMCWPS